MSAPCFSSSVIIRLLLIIKIYMSAAGTNNSACRSEEIVAYLDGELEASALFELEQHFEDCSRCAAALAAERRLIRELDFALASEPAGLEMPKNFAQIVAARAQSDMSGVR